MIEIRYVPLNKRRFCELQSMLYSSLATTRSEEWKAAFLSAKFYDLPRYEDLKEFEKAKQEIFKQLILENLVQPSKKVGGEKDE